MSKPPKLDVLDVADVPLREVSGLVLRGSDLLAVGDHDPVVFSAPLQPWPLDWQAIDLAGLELPDGGTQFEAIQPTSAHTVLVLQEQPARVLHIDLSVPALIGTLLLDVPDGHRLRQAWLGDRSSRGESLVLADRGHLLVVKEKDPSAILEFGPAGDDPVGWRGGDSTVAPGPGDATLTVLATWWLGKELTKRLPDISDATIGPDGRLYLLSDQGSAIARLPDSLDPQGGVVEAEAIWLIAGSPKSAEGLVILDDGTVLVGLDTKSPRRNLLRLKPLPLD
ncbi:MAG: hypothetical protein NT146_06480 [Mycobacterium sp.]|nr:hypothetical protein [Mycobacterium sp.]